MMKIPFVVACLLLFAFPVLAQTRLTSVEPCGTVPYNRWMEGQHPGIKVVREQLQRDIGAFLQHKQARGDSDQVIVIPVVVHIVWHTPEQNIPDEQVYSQIFSLIEDYRRLNEDTIHTPALFKPVAADTRIEFCLAKRTPNDSAHATGILRIYTEKEEFGIDNKVKSPFHGGSRAWDRDQYLNIWVCKLAGNYLGYAQYPGGPDSTDGVVIDYRCFGRVGTLHPHYNKGRTATHEIGHWLDLYHIWGDDFGSCDGTDYVDDTPNAADANYYCPTHPRISNCNSTGEMFMNYMDYCDDYCFNTFTHGQAERMRAALFVARPSLITSDGCDPYMSINELPDPTLFTLYPNPANGTLQLTFPEPVQQPLVQITDIGGRTVHLLQNPDFNVSLWTINVSHWKNGFYFLRLSTKNATATMKVAVQH